MKKVVAICALALAMACSPAERAPSAAPAPDAQAAHTPLTATGPATELPRLPVDENLTWAASVVQLDTLTNEANGGVKLFGLAGGDPAMNGLHTYISFYESPAEGWQVFMLGDFLDYTVLADAPGRVELEIHESTMDEATGNIGSQRRNVIVSWTSGADDTPPATISVTPAAPQQ